MLSIVDSRKRVKRERPFLAYLPWPENSTKEGIQVVPKQTKLIEREQTSHALKLNELVKHRPFNILYKVKRYDPL